MKNNKKAIGLVFVLFLMIVSIMVFTHLSNRSNDGHYVHPRAIADTLSLMTIDALPFLDERINYNVNYVTYAQLYAHEARHGFMYTLTTSFFHYLLSLNTRENFLRVYQDITLMEEIYGKDLEGMFRLWLDYLHS